MSYQSGMNKWTDEEKKYVMKKYKDGMTPEQIHETGKINRSKYAIELKIYNTIYDQIQNGDTYEELATEYKKTKSDIKEIEKKIFEMKNKSSQQTPYTNDGGYVLNTSSQSIPTLTELNEFHHVNRTMNTILHFYENISRLNKLKEEKIIDNDFYNALIKKLNKFEFDKDKIISNLDVITSQSSSSPSTNKTDTDVISDKKEKEKHKDKDKKTTKKKDETSDDDASVEIEIPIKKLKKRII